MKYRVDWVCQARQRAHQLRGRPSCSKPLCKCKCSILLLHPAGPPPGIRAHQESPGQVSGFYRTGCRPASHIRDVCIPPILSCCPESLRSSRAGGRTAFEFRFPAWLQEHQVKICIPNSQPHSGREALSYGREAFLFSVCQGLFSSSPKTVVRIPTCLRAGA